MNCGELNPGDASYCYNCGKALSPWANCDEYEDREKPKTTESEKEVDCNECKHFIKYGDITAWRCSKSGDYSVFYTHPCDMFEEGVYCKYQCKKCRHYYYSKYGHQCRLNRKVEPYYYGEEVCEYLEMKTLKSRWDNFREKHDFAIFFCGIVGFSLIVSIVGVIGCGM